MLPSPFDQLPHHAIKTINLEAGERVFHQGDTPGSIFFLQTGAIRLVRFGEAGSLIPIFRAFPGDTFAEAALFSPTYYCDAEAETASSVVALSKPVILNQMQNDAQFGLALTQRFATQVQGYRRKLEIVSIPGAEDRVFAALSDGWLTGKVVNFAGDIGLSHEATFRALSKLVSEGRAVKLGRGRYKAVEL